MSNPVNWLFLAELIVMVIVVSAFLFYWNRILGSTIAFFVRLVSWRVYGAYIVIGSFQISPLAGRIAFRDVEYHSSNISFRVLHGNLTFRYWKLRVRKDGDTNSGNAKRSRLPCRIALNVEGLELFCYNRTPAYDAIVERMKEHERNDPACAPGLREGHDTTADTTATNSGERSNARLRKTAGRPMSRETSGETGTTSEGIKSSGSSNEKQSPIRQGTAACTTRQVTTLSWCWEALPLEIKITTGSVVLGSDATPMVLIVHYRRARGTVEMSQPRSSCDLYKMSINCGLQEVNVLMRTNLDYSGPLLAHGKNTYDELLKQDPEVAKEPPSTITSIPGFQWLAKRFKFLYDPHFSSPPVAGLPSDRVWKGLARYRLPEDLNSHVHREEREYAKVTTLLSTRALDLSYYTDAPGVVPVPSETTNVDPSDEIGNVEAPPEWGIDLTVHGGNVNYGPWADRQRDALQKAFAPSIFFDTEPRARLKPGDTRVHSALVVNVAMSDKTTLRIPTREASKDWMFDGTKGDVERRYGWLDVVVGANSSVTYSQSQVATERGYESMVVLHLDSLDVASSVNLQSFVVAKACKLSVTMPNPLIWNAQRNWGLDLNLDTPDILLLREHITLISDLAKDWSGGTGADFRHFVPMHYSFRISMVHYAFHLFINDFNIVDVPKSRDHNAFLDICGPRLDAYVAVDSSRYRPEFSVVPFTIDAKNVVVSVSLPKWDTHRSFGKPLWEVGKVGDIMVAGSYRYYSKPSPDHIEKLKLHLEAEKVAFKALGWVVRRIFCVKDNYFGNFTQFSTMQEYQEKFDHSPDAVGDPIVRKYRPGRSDPFSVNLTVDVRDSLVVMSDEIYGCEKGIVIPVPSLLVDLKTNEFQMDLSVDLSPTYATACDDLEQAYTKLASPLARTQDVVFVEGITIHANRLFGPQPLATTYFCLWELSIYRISAFLSPEFASTLSAVGNAVGFNYVDHDNAPASEYLEKTPPDATFVKLSIHQISALMSSGDSGIALDLPNGVFIDTSSMASKSCRSVMGLGIPTVAVHILRRKSSTKRWQPIGSATTGLSLDNYKLPKGWKSIAEAQMAFLKEQDAPTRRVPYLYGEPDNPSYGEFHHDVYVPRPREVLIPWAESESEDVTADEPGFGDSSDSATQSDDTAHSAPISRVSRRKRAMSVATMQEALERRDRNSVGDESDSSSGSSATSSMSSFDEHRPFGTGEDMAVILEDRLKCFKRIHERARRILPHPTAPPPKIVEDDQRSPLVPLTITEGAIFQINLATTVVEVNTDTLYSAVDVTGALGATDVRPEVRLDQLLSYQVDSVLKDHTNRTAKLYDINLPLLEVHLVQGSFSKPESIIHNVIGAPSIRLLQDPVPNSIKTNTTGTVELQTLELTLLKRETSAETVSLVDVPNFEGPPRPTDVLPFVRISASAFGASFSQVAVEETDGHEAKLEKTIQIKAKGVSLQSATPGIPIVTYMIDTWEPILKSLPKHSAILTAADVIYNTLNGAIEAGLLMTFPPFLFESPYGLQFEDQRNIRHDIGWFQLARLRHWMTLLKGKPPQPSPPACEDKTKRIVSELAQLQTTVTEELVVAQPYLRKALGHHLDDAGLTPESRMDSAVKVFIDVATTDVRHYGRMLHSGAMASSAVTIDSVTVANERSKTWDKDVPSSALSSVINIRRLGLDLHDSFLTAVQAILTHVDNHREKIRELPVVQAVDHASIIVVNTNLGQLTAGVAGGGLRLDVSITDAQGSGTVKRSRRTQGAAECQTVEHNAALVSCESVQAVLKEAHNSTVPDGPERELVVAAIKSVHCSSGSTIDSLDAKGGTAYLTLGVAALEFDSRPQLKAFFDFAKDWRRNHFPLYQPTIEQVQALIAKRRESAMCKPSLAVPDKRAVLRSMIVNLKIQSVRMQARAAKGLWLGWDMGEVFVWREGDNNDLAFGVRLDPQEVGAYTTAKRLRNKDASVIRFPSVNVKGTHRQVDLRPNLNADVNLGMFTGIIKPTVLDRLLSLHQRLGHDVLAVVREYRGGETPSPQVSPTKPKVEKTSLVFRIQASVLGVRVGLRADNVPTTLMFEARDLKGSASTETSALQWSAKANEVGLKLIRLADGPAYQTYQTAEPLRGSRSASMAFDISAEEIPGTQHTPSKLNVNFSRVQTVMHVAALNELGDLIRSWSADISLLRKVHAEEVAEVKEQTARVLKKLDVGGSGKDAASITSSSDGAASIETWFAQRVLTVEFTHIGIAIPLSDGATIDFSRSPLGASEALLFSIGFMGLTTSRTETARFRVHETALQFVDHFDPTINRHFQGRTHKSTNYMVLPKIDTEAQMTSTPETLFIVASCSATDFKLALTPDIVDGIGRLTYLYERGKQHLSAMERDYKAEWAKLPPETSDTVAARYEVSPVAASRQKLTVRVSFRFDSGVVELHRLPKDTEPQPPRPAGSKARDQKDRVTLPTVSVWIEYHGSQRSEEEEEGDERTLLFNMAVHESRNIMHPTVLPFFVDIVQRSEQRAKSRPQSVVLPAAPEPTPAEETTLTTTEATSAPLAERAIERIADSSTGKIRFRFSLRIDRSELRLSCAPDSNAYLDLKWESGGLLASTLLGAQDNTMLSGSVSGVTAYLSHEFAEQGRGCIEAGAKDMAISLALCSPDGHRGLSLVLDTQVSGQFRLEAYSAWLIFMSVWVDNAPKFDSKKTTELQPMAQMTPLASDKLSLAVLIRLRSIDFDANIAVSQARLEMTSVTLRTKSDGEVTEVDLTLGTTQVKAVGDISGDVLSESLKFSTARRSSRASDETDPHVLKMKIDAGDLRGNLFIGGVNIVRFQLKPSVVTLSDNWKDHGRKNPDGPIYLDFIVDAGDFSGVVRLPAIPRLLGNFYALFDLAESQTRIAAQRSEMFKMRLNRSEEDQTPMTTVVLPISREEPITPDMTAVPRAHAKTAQMMRFGLNSIDIGIFADDYGDDFNLFRTGKVSASLQRQENKSGLPHRNLELHVATVSWQSSDGRRAAKAETHDMSSQELIAAATTSTPREVVSLPLMTLKMDSTENKATHVVDYDFDVNWGPTDGDVMILPNFFEVTFRSFQKLINGIDEQQQRRAGRKGLVRAKSSAKLRAEAQDPNAPAANPMPSWSFQRRGVGPFNNPVPRLKALGPATGDAAMMIPRIKKAMEELPAYSHRFVTLPLEVGMNLLLKQYERQLPERIV